jgi:hypothetical protein
LVSFAGDEHPARPLLFVDVADYIVAADRRLERFSDAAGEAVQGIFLAGTYASPLVMGELADTSAESPGESLDSSPNESGDGDPDGDRETLP